MRKQHIKNRTVDGNRVCSKCDQWLPVSMFYKSSTTGHQYSCKSCCSTRAAEWYQRDPAAHRKYTREQYLLKRDDRIRYGRAYYHKTKAERKIYMSNWQKNNKAYIKEANARRKATKKRACPAWANRFFMQEIYDLATLRSKYLGIRHEVDHIVPLSSKLVCGLHVENNLRVITYKENYSKGNRHWPDMS